MLIPWQKDRLEELVALWNKELGDDFPMREALFEQNSFADPNLFTEGSRIAVNEEGRAIGFVVAKKWQDEIDIGHNPAVGWIQVLLVDRDYRKQGIGSQLLKHAESKLSESGIKQILLGKDTKHYFPGIPTADQETAKWFQNRGYEVGGEEFDLDRVYQADESLVIPTKDGVELSLLTLEEKDHFIEFLEQSFPGRWKYEAIDYFEKGGTGREFVVLKKNDRIIGFCRINDSNSPVFGPNVYWAPLYDGELGGVGPLGIDRAERKQGFGLLIVEAGIAFLRQRGISSIVIDWTGLVAFYHKLGYEVCKSYTSHQKNL